MRIKNDTSGFTLIEILVSILILAFLVVGGASTLFHTQSNVRLQGKKRIAMELANQRIELAKFNTYQSIVGTMEYDVDNRYYLITDSSTPYSLVQRDGKVADVIPVGGDDYTIYTKLLRHSKDAGTVSFDPEALQINVTVEFSASTEDKIDLETLVLPPEVTN